MARLFSTGASDGLITELLGNQNHLYDMIPCRIRLDVSCVGVLRGAWHGLTLKFNACRLVEPQDYGWNYGYGNLDAQEGPKPAKPIG